MLAAPHLDAGWGHDDFLWYVRGIPNVRKVWEQLHDTEDVIVSFDGANIQRPWGLNPEWRGGAGTLQANATATEAFECFAAQLPILDSLGLIRLCLPEENMEACLGEDEVHFGLV